MLILLLPINLLLRPLPTLSSAPFPALPPLPLQLSPSPALGTPSLRADTNLLRSRRSGPGGVGVRSPAQQPHRDSQARVFLGRGSLTWLPGAQGAGGRSLETETAGGRSRVPGSRPWEQEQRTRAGRTSGLVTEVTAGLL